MKKFRILAYVVVIIIVGIISFIIFKGGIKNNDENEKEKDISETKYLESKLVDLLNTMNNIKDKNYDISVSKIPEEIKNTTSGGGTAGNNSKGGNGSGQSGEGRKFRFRRRFWTTIFR